MKKQHRFLQAGIFSWILLPFISLIFSSAREILMSRVHGNQPDSWLILLSSLILFYWLTYFFLRFFKGKYYTKTLWQLGIIWCALAVILSSLIAAVFYQVPFHEILENYYFWNNEPWPWVILAILCAPFLTSLLIRR